MSLGISTTWKYNTWNRPFVVLHNEQSTCTHTGKMWVSSVRINMYIVLVSTTMATIIVVDRVATIDPIFQTTFVFTLISLSGPPSCFNGTKWAPNQRRWYSFRWNVPHMPGDQLSPIFTSQLGPFWYCIFKRSSPWWTSTKGIRFKVCVFLVGECSQPYTMRTILWVINGTCQQFKNSSRMSYLTQMSLLSKLNRQL